MAPPSLASLALMLVGLAAAWGYLHGARGAVAIAGGDARRLHSRPAYHGVHLAIMMAAPALMLWIVWTLAAPGLIDSWVLAAAPEAIRGGPTTVTELFVRNARAIAQGGISSEVTPDLQTAAARYATATAVSTWGRLVIIAALIASGFVFGARMIAIPFRARNRVETYVRWLLIACSTVAVVTTIGIVLSLIFESIRFFQLVPFTEFLFGVNWSPQTALRAEQVGSSGAFGAIPLFAGTLMITMIAMAVAAPVGLFAAIYLSDYAGPKVRATAKPLMEILAGIPTVVYGFFAALTVAPAIRGFGEGIGLDVASESALAAGVVMGIMIIPFVSSLSDDVINAVPQSLRDGSLGLGATKSETMRRVILPAALPGIVSAMILAFSRAIGETMIVVMAAGLAANLTINPLEAVTTVTVQIVTLLVGDQEFDSAKTLAAFALGLTLFCITLALNFIALRVVQRYREAYD